MGPPHATAVSARVALLIARHHGGDQNAAALRLGIDPDALTDLLSGDWRRFSLGAMAALVRRHNVSIRWLLGSSPMRKPRRRPPIRPVGTTYGPRAQSLEIELESGELRAYQPKEAWAIEEDDGFVRATEIVRDDDTTEIVRVRRLGVQRAD